MATILQLKPLVPLPRCRLPSTAAAFCSRVSIVPAKVGPVCTVSTRNVGVQAASSGAFSDPAKKLSTSDSSRRFSDVLWPTTGAFVAMLIMTAVHKLLEPRGLVFLIAPFGAVCCTLFLSPDAPASRVYNVMVAHLGCSLIGILSLATFGTGWAARSIAVASSLAFMEITRCIHPAAAGLPLLLMDAPKMQALKWLYVIFPSAAGCLILLFLKPAVKHMKENVKF